MILKKINSTYYLVGHLSKNNTFQIGDYIIHSSHGYDKILKIESIVEESNQLILEDNMNCWKEYARKIIASNMQIGNLPCLRIEQLAMLTPEQPSYQDCIDRLNTPARYNSTKQQYFYSEQDIKDILEDFTQQEINYKIAKEKKEWDVEIEMVVNKERCHCRCHSDNGIMHIMACCQNGWKYYPMSEIKITDDYINITKIY